jgi:hypothetical protein
MLLRTRFILDIYYRRLWFRRGGRVSSTVGAVIVATAMAVSAWGQTNPNWFPATGNVGIAMTHYHLCRSLDLRIRTEPERRRRRRNVSSAGEL